MSEPSLSDNSAAGDHTPNETSDTTTAKQVDRHHPRKKDGNDGWVWQTLFTLALLAALGAAGYFTWQTIQSRTQQLSTDQEMTRQQLDDLNKRTRRLEQQVDSSLAEDIKSLQSQQQALKDSLAALRSELTGDARVWDVEEIATLLRIANDRLQLENEVAPSLAALEAADRHIQALKNPGLLNVRQLLAEEITALRATPDPDIEGMALSLNALIQGVGRLPIASASLQQPKRPASVTEEGWRGILSDLWEKLKSLVTIQHHGQTNRPLLAPDERYFLRQNLRLNLEAARVALLRRDKQTFQQTLRSVQEWITQYFDTDATPTIGALQELAHLQQIDIAPDLPDISGSLKALQTWLTEQKTHSAKRAAGVEQP